MIRRRPRRQRGQTPHDSGFDLSQVASGLSCVDGANFAGRRSLEPSVSAACRLSDGLLTRTTGIASCVYILWLIFTSITIYPLFSLSLLAWAAVRKAAGGRQSPDSLKSQLNSEVAVVPRFSCVGLAVRQCYAKRRQIIWKSNMRHQSWGRRARVIVPAGAVAFRDVRGPEIRRAGPEMKQSALPSRRRSVIGRWVA
jgi:hypothetical protein